MDEETMLKYDHKDMVKFIQQFGFDAFSAAVYHGMFIQHALTFVHPSDEIRALPFFDEIHRAMVNAIC